MSLALIFDALLCPRLNQPLHLEESLALLLWLLLFVFVSLLTLRASLLIMNSRLLSSMEFTGGTSTKDCVQSSCVVDENFWPWQFTQVKNLHSTYI